MQAPRDELQASIRRVLARSDEAWYRSVLASDVSGCPLHGDEEARVVHGAMAAAEEVRGALGQRYPDLPPDALADALGIRVVAMGEEDDVGAFPLLGRYEPGKRQISLHEGALAAIERFIVNGELASLTPPGDLRACVLYHELFHAIEETTPGIFTRSAMLQRKLFGLVPRRRGLASASEIGAIHFSRLMAATPYSPCIFGHYLLLAEGRIDLSVRTGEDSQAGRSS